MSLRLPFSLCIRGCPLSGRGGGSRPAPFPVSRLAWINDFFSAVRPYLFFRDEDAVLILPPNRVTSLNESATRILSHMCKRGRIELFDGLRDGERAEDVNRFFSNLKAMYEGALDDTDAALAVERTAFSFDFTKLPVLGEIAVTYRCNNRCLFCYAGCGNGTCRRDGIATDGIATDGIATDGIAGDRIPAELSTGRIKRIIRIFRRDARIPFFSFTGGEPLLRRDLEKLIRYAVRIGLRINLITNGTLATAERARSLARAGLESAQVSLESSNAVLHDRLTGVRGSWERTLAGIRNLQAAGIAVQTNTTITALNADRVAEMPAFLAQIGIIRFSMNLFIPTSAVSNDGLFFPYTSIGPVIDAVRRNAVEHGLTFFWYSPVPHCLYNPISRGMGNKSCAAMDGLLSVSPRGDVLPCSSYNEPMGNLLEKPFRRIWFSDRAAYFKYKRYAPGECEGCDRFVACQSACPLYWKYAGTGEIRNPSPVAASVEEAELWQ